VPGYPGLITPIDHVEPVPRQIRGYVDGQVLFDTHEALYVWEFPPYPQFYIPREAVDGALLLDEDRTQNTKRGKVQVYGLAGADGARDASARLYVESDVAAIVGHFRFDWSAVDAWFEEDEEIFVHPRNPYARTDVLRSSKRVRVELEGVVLAETGAPLILFETGLPPRYYLNRTDVKWDHLVPSDAETECPYKGTTSDYWSVEIDGTVYPDLAWSYDFPTRDVLPIKNQVAFYDEKVDVFIDDVLQERPQTPFS
jgi:uncharacterized protein (DUF427 family)